MTNIWELYPNLLMPTYGGSTMTTPGNLLRRLVGIKEGVPFQGRISAVSEDGKSSVSGTVLFQLGDGRLQFEFYISPEPGEGSYLEVVARGKGKVTLEIPSRDFRHRAFLHTILVASDRYDPLVGRVDVSSLGNPSASLSSATLHLVNLPPGQWGSGNTYHQSQVQKGGQRISGRTILLNSQDLSGGEWSINLQELPVYHQDTSAGSHVCSISRQDGKTFTGEELRVLVEKDLQPFLWLMFGQFVQYSMLEGHGSSQSAPSTPWGTVFPHSERRESLPVRNWYTKPTVPSDVAPLFDAYSQLPEDIKRYFQKVIRKYVASETLGHSERAEILEEAASVSFSGLEGLTRSIISTYTCRDKWLDRNLQLRRGKGIKAALEMVIKKELGELVEQSTLVSALASVRNSNVHTDLTTNIDDYTEIHFRWEQSQFLIEALLLARLGLKEIPNRTSSGQFNLMGTDMLSAQRQYEIQRETDSDSDGGEVAHT